MRARIMPKTMGHVLKLRGIRTNLGIKIRRVHLVALAPGVPRVPFCPGIFRLKSLE